MIFLIGAPILAFLSQLIGFGFHLSTIFWVVGRVCMLLRVLGSKVKLSVCIAFEIIGTAIMCIRPILTRKPISLTEVIIGIIISIILILSIVVDDMIYVYVEEKENESSIKQLNKD